MISPELVRRYPFFAGLEMEQINFLAMAAEEVEIPAGDYIFREGDEVDYFYVVQQGSVGIVLDVPAQHQETVVSNLGPGDVFAWSGLVSPHKATASAKALTPATLLSFDFNQISEHFTEDWHFGYLMLLKATEVMRDRLHDMRIESLAFLTK
jgi:CRP-like cAMP-binding protein